MGAVDAGVDKGRFMRCLRKRKLDIARSGEVKGVDREGLEIEGVEYLGFVVWPDKSVADVYHARNDDAATTIWTQLTFLYASEVEDPRDYVKRRGNWVIGLDDKRTPDRRKARRLLACT